LVLASGPDWALAEGYIWSQNMQKQKQAMEQTSQAWASR
jgi:hypothetical protein